MDSRREVVRMAVLAIVARLEGRGVVMPDDIAAFKTEAAFRRQLWSAVLDLYRGENTVTGFEDSFLASIENQLTRAWNAGGREMGVEPEDHTEADKAMLQEIIVNELGFVSGLAADVVAAREAEAGFQQFASRIGTWATRYPDVENRAKVHFGGKRRLVWRLGATEEHCDTCARLNGIVAWAAEWELSGVHPQNPPNGDLECGGWNCDCSLDPTEEPRSRNAYDRIMGIVG